MSDPIPDDMRAKADALATEFERRSKEAHDREPDSVPSMTRDNAVWASYRDAAYELRATFGVPFGSIEDPEKTPWGDHKPASVRRPV